MDLSKYYESIIQQPILSKEEEEGLIAIIKDESSSNKQIQEATDKLIRANLRFVFKMAKVHSKNDPQVFEELISAGNEGLLVGLSKYKPTKKVRFLSYAGWWVLQRILREMSDMRLVSLPIWRQQLSAKISKIKDRNEEVTLTDLKQAFPSVAEKDLVELSRTKYLTYYIDDMCESEFPINPIEETIEQIDNNKLLELVSRLPEQQKEIIKLSFGLENNEENSVSDILSRLNITREQYKTLKADALKKLQVYLTGDASSSKNSVPGTTRLINVV